MPRSLYVQTGKRRCFVQIQQQTTTQDPEGGELAAWATIRSTWASIVTSSMLNAFQSDQFSGQVTHVINILALTGTPEITPGMQVLYTQSSVTHTYIIQAVDNIEMRNYQLNLMCLEINGGQ